MGMTNHVELARICQAVWDAEVTQDETLTEQTPSIKLRRVEGYRYGVCQIPYGSILMGTSLVTCIVPRGSKTVRDWLTDLDAKMVWTPLGNVHHGFEAVAELILKDMVDIPGPYVFAGHSLGGAEATRLAAGILSGSTEPQTQPLEVVTFGSPRVGDTSFRDSYAPLARRTSRYDYLYDPVPWMPFWCQGYRHIVPPRWFDGEKWCEGVGWFSIAKKIWKARKALAVLSGGYFDANVKISWDKVEGMLLDHHISNYVAALDPSNH